MPQMKRKVPQTLNFVEGLLNSADAISGALDGEILHEPRQIIPHLQTKISGLSPAQIQELGKYQGRVVLAALAAELALKFAWEMENRSAAPKGHKLLKCFRRLSGNLKEEIEKEYGRRITDLPEKEWETVDQIFEICSEAFENWRYLVEEGRYPNYIMRATYLIEATRSVIEVAKRRVP